jgi:hypothetical protein
MHHAEPEPNGRGHLFPIVDLCLVSRLITIKPFGLLDDGRYRYLDVLLWQPIAYCGVVILVDGQPGILDQVFLAEQFLLDLPFSLLRQLGRTAAQVGNRESFWDQTICFD